MHYNGQRYSQWLQKNIRYTNGEGYSPKVQIVIIGDNEKQEQLVTTNP